MSLSDLSYPALTLLLLAALAVQLGTSWRIQIGGLAAQYIAAFLLVSLSWPADLAAVKLVAGLFGCSILGATRLNAGPPRTGGVSLGISFRLALSILILLTAFSLAPGVVEAVPNLQLVQAIGGLALMGLGLIQLGISSQILQITFGLLSLLTGFEIVYAVVESASLVAGLLAMINLSLALIGSYLIANVFLEETE